jgi:hypothetical protein
MRASLIATLPLMITLATTVADAFRDEQAHRHGHLRSVAFGRRPRGNLRPDRHPRESTDAVKLRNRSGHRGDATVGERLARLQREQRREVASRHRLVPHHVDGDETMQRAAPDVERHDHLAVSGFAHIRGFRGPIPLLPEKRFDVAARVFEQVEIDAALLPNRHQRVAAVIGKRIPGKDDADPRAAIGGHRQINRRRVPGKSSAHIHIRFVIPKVAQRFLKTPHAIVDRRSVIRAAALEPQLVDERPPA